MAGADQFQSANYALDVLESHTEKHKLNADWMSSLDDDTTLGDITWPGTHDSGAICEVFDFSRVVSDECAASVGTKILNYSPACLKRFVSKWTRAQRLDISEQLQHGARYLDLRVSKCPADEVFYIFHTFCGPPLDHVFNDIVTFMDQNTQECLMIEVTPRCFATAQEDLDNLSDQIESKLGHLLLRRNPSDGNLSPFLYKLSHLRENGRVVVFYNLSFAAENASIPSAFWDSKYLNAPFTPTLNPEVDESFQIMRFGLYNHAHDTIDFDTSLASNTTQMLTEFESAEKQMFHFKYALTPGFKEIVRSLFPCFSRCYPCDLEQCAQTMNPRLRNHVENIQKFKNKEKREGVVFSIDYIEQSELVEIAIQENN